MKDPSECVTVLIVDDDIDIREVLSEALQDEGYDTASVPDGVEALAWLRRTRRPCIILLDLTMPGMDGLDFRAEQSRDPAIRDIPVVVFSADPGVHDKAGDLRAAAHLKKPVTLDALLDVVRALKA
jgi:CheY-like chemotaxis protein